MENGEAPVTTEEKALTPKQRQFIENYLGPARFNATKAALLAGYSARTAYAIGYENLRKPAIQTHISRRLSELTLGRSEVLARLSDIATASVEDLLDDDGTFDYKRAKKAGQLGLVKKVKVREIEKPGFAGSEPTTERIYEFEMYSAHEALRDLGKHHKLFTEKVEHSGLIGLDWGEIAREANQPGDVTSVTDETAV